MNTTILLGYREAKDRFRDDMGVLSLWDRFKPTRSKVLDHTNFKTLTAEAVFGFFPESADEEYFDALQDLVNEEHEKWVADRTRLMILPKSMSESFSPCLNGPVCPSKALNRSDQRMSVTANAGP